MSKINAGDLVRCLDDSEPVEFGQVIRLSHYADQALVRDSKTKVRAWVRVQDLATAA